jgi:hypothetical protein
MYTLSIALFLFWFFLESCVSGYRDMVRFWEEGTWNFSTKAKWLPYWTVKEGSQFDPFHAAGGFMWALVFILITIEAISYFITQKLLIIKTLPLFWFGYEWYLVFVIITLHGAGLWICFYWIRNIFMHILGIASGYRRFNYFWPPPIRWLFNMKN